MNIITVEQFKQYFRRDFPYLPVYDEEHVYNKDDEVYSDKFYISLKDDNTSPLTDSDAWSRIKDDVLNYVLDQDIQQTIDEMVVFYPEGLRGLDDETIQILQLYLTAHLLVNYIQMSNQGLASTVSGAIVTGKSVGSVSQQFGLPTSMIDNELLTFYVTTRYGLKYLSLVLPYIRGHIGCVAGATQP